jgi:galactokinase
MLGSSARAPEHRLAILPRSVRCGIRRPCPRAGPGQSDQVACSLAGQDAALLLDTRSITYTRIPFPPGAALLVVDSGVRHSHASGAYRLRREECERAAGMLGVPSLRELTIDDLDRIARLPPPLDRRTRHVVTENRRMIETADALLRKDLRRVGELFAASHEPMRADFEVSVPEVDALVANAMARPGIYGARLTGGGFGEAIVALADSQAAQGAGEAIVALHHRTYPVAASVLVLAG